MMLPVLAFHGGVSDNGQSIAHRHRLRNRLLRASPIDPLVAERRSTAMESRKA
jgi:hypothetical protein